MSNDSSSGSSLKGLFFNRAGTLTRQLLRQPGKYGLGQVPERLAPDRTTTLTCGFCATGQAGFTRHLTTGEIVEQVARAGRGARQSGRRVSNHSG